MGSFRPVFLATEHQPNFVHFFKTISVAPADPRTAAACDRIRDYSQRDLAFLKWWDAWCRQHALMASVEPPLAGLKKIRQKPIEPL